ncbi:hypothetical protein [Allohahella sp. A8]|uniref:hypothetical protein n=1 Tax=Allohahella sp. A8 TaxID=3141461 RepID=UPI003A807E73
MLKNLSLQRGQAMPLIVGFAAIISFATLLVFNNAMGGVERMRTSSAADAAVYSGAVWQARMLNGEAYMNKGMVANQVAIAQLVSIQNWVQYVDRTAENFDDLADVLIPLKIISTPLLAATTAAATATELFVIPATIVTDRVIGALQDTQDALHTAGRVGASSIMTAVVRENDERFEVTDLGILWMEQNQDDWRNFTISYKDLEGMTRKKTVIENSQDQFSDNRSWKWRVPLYMSTVAYVLKEQVVKHGETRLYMEADPEVENKFRWQWRSRDTMSYHVGYFDEWGWPRSPREVAPIGWHQTTLDSGEQIKQNWGSRWSRNKEGEDDAIEESEELIATYQGVRTYRDVAELDTTEQEGRDPRLIVAIEIVLPSDEVRNTSNTDIGSDQAPESKSRNGLGLKVFGMDDGYSESEIGGDRGVAAVAAAEIFFRRPVERQAGKFGAQDSKEEFANLFNPYWDVRLKDSSEHRELAWATRGLAAIPNGAAAQ